MSCISDRLSGIMNKKENVYGMANETVVKFIELYRSCECLWNVSSEDYGCRLSRNTAYDFISKKMRIPGFGPREVARKIKNLRLAYQHELRRIEDSERRSGSVRSIYRPRAVWFELLDDFLRNSEKSSQSTEDSEMIVHENDLPTEKMEKNVMDSSKTLYRNSVSRKRRSSSEDAYRTCEEQQQQRKYNRRETNTIESEEYDSFGKYVASSLSRMPFEYAVSAESEIHNVIIKYKVYAMRKIVYPTTKTTRTMGGMREGTTRHSPSTYLPPSNFSFALRQRTKKTRPSSGDSIGHASD